MKGLLARRPSAAMIVAIVALVMASVGTGYAALKLPKNSVGVKQIKKNAVTTAKVKKEAITPGKIKKGSITGTQIDLTKLGTVPSATTATTAGTANALAPLETIHLVGAGDQPGFEGGSSNIGASGPLKLQSAGFYKDHEGIVHLEGLVKSGGASPSGGSIFTLPPGFRPPSGTLLIFEPLDEAPVLIFGGNTVVGPFVLDGKVSGGKPEETTSLEGISFRAGS